MIEKIIKRYYLNSQYKRGNEKLNIWGDKKICLYGYGYAGKFWLDRLVLADIDVECVVDKNLIGETACGWDKKFVIQGG